MKKITVIVFIFLLMIWILPGCAVLSPPASLPVTGKAGRIVSMSLDSDEILLGLVPPERIAALSSLADSPVSYVQDKAAGVPGRIRNNTLEEVLSFHPDLVILSGWESEDFRKTLTDMGIRVYSYQSASRLDQIPAVIRGIAEAAGDRSAGESAVSRYERQLDQIRKAVPAAHREHVIYVWAFSHPYGPGDSFFGDMCRFLDIRNTLNDMNEKELSAANREFLIASDPDMILLSDFIMSPEKIHSMQSLFLQDPSLSGLQAVRNRALIPLPPRVLYCPSQYAVQGMQELYQAVYGRPLPLPAT